MQTTVFVGTSVDGFIARPDGRFDFLRSDGGEAENHGGFEDFFATVDALLMGRNTYEVVLAMGGWFYRDKPVFVLSHHGLKPAPAEARVEPIHGTVSEALDQLQARGFKHVYVDGGNVIHQALREHRVNRIVRTQVPVLIGEGISLFGPLGFDQKLELVSTKVLPGGAVQSEYRVVSGAAAPASA
ncbi:dihydrofolate reductase family protein [Pelomonas sp. SE-A7]|uniref:dihydrofolate reductase family protein n=1 Tax=Pelomonas sp. SE-A7 TaxID=3054953 RepID=UPI00259CD768|nr:dihydrofolate reductase family protein [Pelomonas sp. SE-A7]MDM4765409.1 dihydrofolate reductase family protein [Pelomonas sp. SE-A7]